MMVEGSQQETLDLSFMLLGTLQKCISVILRELIIPDEFDPVSPSFTRILYCTKNIILNKADNNNNNNNNNNNLNLFCFSP
ncbi:unnamed protein product [Schistosoma margrebowiei]|uniref:Uncharacterized protein n=1 Tax=Schistosoma margrebowiei TaxID=48269 RepID=A0A183LAV1_9TREM|nr:unnamed protein product [Schistosoma margrebowiei]